MSFSKGDTVCFKKRRDFIPHHSKGFIVVVSKNSIIKEKFGVCFNHHMKRPSRALLINPQNYFLSCKVLLLERLDR